MEMIMQNRKTIAVLLCTAAIASAQLFETANAQSVSQKSSSQSNKQRGQQKPVMPAPARLPARDQSQTKRIQEAEQQTPSGHLIILSDRARIPSGRGKVAQAERRVRIIAARLLQYIQAGPAVSQSLKITTGGLNVIFVDGLSEQQVSKLSNSRLVSGVEAAVAMDLDGTDTNPQNWGSDRIDQINLPLDGSHDYTDASSIHIYVLDSGVDATHPEFGGRVIETRNFTSDSVQACDNHGTYSASFAAGATRGISRGAAIHDLKVATCAGSGSQFEVISAINHVLNTRTGPSVMNMSFSFDAQINSLNNLVRSAINQGVVAVTSSGNKYGLACIRSPNMVTEMLTVGASAVNDSRPSFSNRGGCVDVHAPGVNVNGARNGGSYGPSNGTSFSSPMVAGIAASIWSDQPGLSAAQVMQQVVDRATPGILSNIPGGTPNRLAHYKKSINQPPVPAVGVNWSYVYSGRPGVQLDGTQSSDPDNHTPLTYNWSQTLGPAVALSDPTSPTPTFTAPAVNTPTNLNFTLTATDSLGLSSTQLALVSVVVTPDACTPYDQARMLSEFPILSTGQNGSGSVVMDKSKVEATLTQYVSDAQATNALVSGATLNASLKDRGAGALPANAATPVADAPLHTASVTPNGFAVGNSNGPANGFWMGAPLKPNRWYEFLTTFRPIHNGGGMHNLCNSRNLVFRLPTVQNSQTIQPNRPLEIYDMKNGTTQTISIPAFSLMFQQSMPASTQTKVGPL